jgi:hypothetical protein
VSAGERGLHLRAEDGGERVAGEQKARVRGSDPRLAVRREATSGDEEVDVRMILQRARPGVQDGDNPDRATDPLAIVGEGLHGGSGLAKECGIDHSLVGARDGAELVGEGEREQIVIAREQPLLDAVEPVLRAIVLTLGAVAIATGVIAVGQRAAIGTAIERAAEARRATLADVVERAALGRQEPPGVRVDVRRPGGANDVRELNHDPACCRLSRAASGH